MSQNEISLLPLHVGLQLFKVALYQYQAFFFFFFSVSGEKSWELPQHLRNLT